MVAVFSKLVKLEINYHINDRKKLSRICRRFKFLLVNACFSSIPFCIFVALRTLGAKETFIRRFRDQLRPRFT